LLGDDTGLRAAAEQLKTISPVAYAFACTSGSFVRGNVGEREAAHALTEAGGAPGITTSGAIIAALRKLGASTVAIATPYDAAITARLEAYLIENGVTVSG